MRPRPLAAEKARAARRAHRRRQASMRPRPLAAEKAPGTPSPTTSKSFNEAAASRRGKVRFAYADPPYPGASMRPRPLAAEKATAPRPRP